MKNSQKIALGSMMCALGMVFMCLGTVIPIATFACPALTAVALIPVMEECGNRYAMCVWAATSALSLMFAPDKEAALLYLFLGYYPVLKPRFDRLRLTAARVLAKLALFDIAAGAMLACAVFLLGMQSILREYMEMSMWLIVVFVVLCNVTMLMYDRLYGLLKLVYRLKLRKKVFRIR